MSSQSLADLRREYTHRGLDEKDVLSDPLAQFDRWMKDAVSAGLREANAMTLATISADGTPSTRIVLLKDFDDKGFVFYTNYESRKAHALTAHPRASLLFYWAELERQVRLEGVVEKTPAHDSEKYFHTRPRESQLGAWASPQSHVIPSRVFLEEQFAELKKQYDGKAIPCPPHWGGYRLLPNVIEFWQGRTKRLHDRIEFVRDGDHWNHHRLAP